MADQSFRQRVEAVVDADAVTFNVSGTYGDLQGMVPSLPDLRALNSPAETAEPENPRTHIIRP